MTAEIASLVAQILKDVITIIVDAAKGDKPPPAMEIRTKIAKALLDHAQEWIIEAQKEADREFNAS